MKALIVDDSKIVRNITAKILDELGIASDQAENGIEAIKKIKTNKYQIILLDWHMPEMDGMEFLDKVKAERLLDEGSKIIICTTENDPVKIESALLKGADEYIMKPYNKEIVEDKLKIIGVL